MKLKLIIAYDGTAYDGWQVQESGTGVQALVEKALAEVLRGTYRVHSSSRTDSGVHALGMVVHVQIPDEAFKMEIRKVALAINARLPDDIRVSSASRAPDSFHARFDATGKQYRYLVWSHPVMNPLLRSHAWHVPQGLKLDAMRVAARCFVGTHDFRSMAATHRYDIPDTVRTLTRVNIRQAGPLLTFIIEGDGFLYKMCRGIVGTLVQVGRGRYKAADITEMLNAKDRRFAGMSAPAYGLILWKVLYSGVKRPWTPVPRQGKAAAEAGE